MDIGQRIRSRREALGLTQEELGRELAVTYQHVSGIEAGASSPSLELLVRVARRLGVTTDYLLTGEERTPVDASGAIRQEPALSPQAKRHLIGLLEELRQHD